MTVSDTHADTIREALQRDPEHLTYSRDAHMSLDALVAERDSLNIYVGALKEVATDIRKERDRERARADRLTKALVEHHAMHNLSDAAIRESIGRTCQICARAALSAGSGGQETTP